MEFNGKIKLSLDCCKYEIECNTSEDSSKGLLIKGNNEDDPKYGIIFKSKISDVDLSFGVFKEDERLSLTAESKYNLAENCKLGIKWEKNDQAEDTDENVSVLLNTHYNLKGIKLGLDTEQIILGRSKTDNVIAENFGYKINPYFENTIDTLHNRLGFVVETKEKINEFGYEQKDYQKYLELGLRNTNKK